MEPQVQQWVDKKRVALAKMAWEATESDPLKSVLGNIDPTALRTLLSAFLQTSCLEEARILLRYQQGRDRDKWPKAVVDAIEGVMRYAEKDVSERDELKGCRDAAHVALLRAWFSYLVQLHRFHYAAQRDARAQGRQANVR